MQRKILPGSAFFYQTKKGALELKGDPAGETIWANLNQIAELFGRDKSVISRHIKNIFRSRELSKDSTVAKIATVQTEGKRKVTREVEFYNLDVVLSVGYRVDSKQATKFRIWATNTLKKHLVDGFTVNEKRLKKKLQEVLCSDSKGKSFASRRSRSKPKRCVGACHRICPDLVFSGCLR